MPDTQSTPPLSPSLESGDLQKIYICCDVGNTSLVFGIFSGDSLERTWRLRSQDTGSVADIYASVMAHVRAYFQATDEFSKATDGTIQAFIEQKIQCHICVGSVVPRITDIFESLPRFYSGIDVHIFKSSNPYYKDFTGVETPAEVGADIVLNGIAGYQQYQQSLLIIDFGTAITFDYFNEKGHFIGTSIVPGVEISLKSLYTVAALLPKVEIQATKRVIGRHTEECMRSGIFWGYVSLVEGMISRIKTELGENPVVLATGGLSSLFVSEIPAIEKIDNTLTLQGLRIIQERIV